MRYILSRSSSPMSSLRGVTAAGARAWAVDIRASPRTFLVCSFRPDLSLMRKAGATGACATAYGGLAEGVIRHLTRGSEDCGYRLIRPTLLSAPPGSSEALRRGNAPR